MGIDHDEDGKFDQDKLVSGTNPLIPLILFKIKMIN
jgi:hypothetical protein